MRDEMRTMRRVRERILSLLKRIPIHNHHIIVLEMPNLSRMMEMRLPVVVHLVIAWSTE